MKFKFFIAAMLAATMLLAFTACGKTQSPTASDKLDSTVQQTEQQNDAETSANEDSSTHRDETSENKSAPTGKQETSSTKADEASEDDAWKENFEKHLLEDYGVIPEYYEDLGDGIYQVYVKMGDKVVPFVTVDSATGNYHG